MEERPPRHRATRRRHRAVVTHTRTAELEKREKETKASMEDSRTQKSFTTSSLDRKTGKQNQKTKEEKANTPRRKTSTAPIAQADQGIRDNSKRGVNTNSKVNRGNRISNRRPTTNQDIINRIDNSHMTRKPTRK